MKTLGTKIYELRRKNGLSQEELGFDVGVSRQTISKWESDTMQPTTDSIMTLCEYFKVTSEYFLGNDKPASSNDNATTVVTNVSSEPSNEVAATIAVSAHAESHITTTAAIYSRKKIIVFTLLIALSAVVLVVSAIIGGVAISIASMPKLGDYETHVFNADVLAIVCGILALGALSAVVTLIILLKRNKKCKMECLVDKM